MRPVRSLIRAAANKLLSDNGWVKGADGVRARGGQRLEFEYSTTAKYNGAAIREAIFNATFRRSASSSTSRTILAIPSLARSCLEGRHRRPREPWRAGMTSPSLRTPGGYDPDDSFLLSCDQIPPTGYNIDFYCNHALDALYKQEQATADPGRASMIFRQIHQIYLTEFPFIVLFSPPDISIVRKGTHNYQPSAIEGGTVNIWEWWCDKGKC